MTIRVTGRGGGFTVGVFLSLQTDSGTAEVEYYVPVLMSSTSSLQTTYLRSCQPRHDPGPPRPETLDTPILNIRTIYTTNFSLVSGLTDPSPTPLKDLPLRPRSPNRTFWTHPSPLPPPSHKVHVLRHPCRTSFRTTKHPRPSRPW